MAKKQSNTREKLLEIISTIFMGACLLSGFIFLVTLLGKFELYVRICWLILAFGFFFLVVMTLAITEHSYKAAIILLLVSVLFISGSFLIFYSATATERKIERAIHQKDLIILKKIAINSDNEEHRIKAIAGIGTVLLRSNIDDVIYKDGSEFLCNILASKDKNLESIATDALFYINLKNIINPYKSKLETICEEITQSSNAVSADHYLPLEKNIVFSTSETYFTPFNDQFQEKDLELLKHRSSFYILEEEIETEREIFKGMNALEVKYFLDGISSVIYKVETLGVVGHYSPGGQAAHRIFWKVWIIDLKHNIVTAHNTFTGGPPAKTVYVPASEPSSRRGGMTGSDPSFEQFETWVFSLPIK